jgi:magnesium chelatase subunit H
MGWPRIDVVATVSGVFRDLMPLQIRLLAEAAWLAAHADEPADKNYVRKHALQQAEALGCDLSAASLRVFSNAEQAYGANVNQTVDGSLWDDEAELGELFATRKSWAYDRSGSGDHRPELLDAALSGVSLTYQNLDSIELGVSDVDQYFDSLGGLSRAASNRSAQAVPVYVGDETRPGDGTVRTLAQQIELETRTRVLNPKWYEAMLAHGYQGVREIESRVTAAVGWSATTDAVPKWVYRDVSKTFLLDPEMRRRLAELNPDATLNINRRVLEAFDRGYWDPSPEELQALEDATDDLEDRIEGINEEAAA